ncbi:hypothetical protein [Deinococcus soli (ex Cha et al. 2016)]|uniref:Uncharacterized protein n=2 Tax=Deinococcus soli (ex Cha et al. 2016) TaxID=1309411 RepID=A0ACC6KFQ1_9DEIO|nr:hypothetical protein [Deinococcus soli (ex Cha et al. 2016)]MDR6218404.1 hypothetical protein [Deinococcus soli (ex Cha et al. 2016)]MDR6329144.1 hypothetical protein [Deinococcus soli (ex Cha et al. 2016)]MDR6751417.1 hypothetical protein [Deinococcus soli (ex Cha et al. 2016)]
MRKILAEILSHNLKYSDRGFKVIDQDGEYRLLDRGAEVGILTVADGVEAGYADVHLHLPSGLSPCIGAIVAGGTEMEVNWADELALAVSLAGRPLFSRYAPQLISLIRDQPEVLDIQPTQFPYTLHSSGLLGSLDNDTVELVSSGGGVSLRYACGKEPIAHASDEGTFVYSGGQRRRVS